MLSLGTMLCSAVDRHQELENKRGEGERKRNTTWPEQRCLHVYMSARSFKRTVWEINIFLLRVWCASSFLSLSFTPHILKTSGCFCSRSDHQRLLNETPGVCKHPGLSFTTVIRSEGGLEVGLSYPACSSLPASQSSAGGILLDCGQQCQRRS